MNAFIEILNRTFCPPPVQTYQLEPCDYCHTETRRDHDHRCTECGGRSNQRPEYAVTEYASDCKPWTHDEIVQAEIAAGCHYR